jgi:hypothetical protein
LLCSFGGRFSHSHASAFLISPDDAAIPNCARTAVTPPPTAYRSMASQYRGHSAVDSLNPILTPSPSPPPVRSSRLYCMIPSAHDSPRLNPALFLEDLVTLIVELERNLGMHNPWTRHNKRRYCPAIHLRKEALSEAIIHHAPSLVCLLRGAYPESVKGKQASNGTPDPFRIKFL